MSHSVATSTAVFHHAAEVVVSAGQITAGTTVAHLRVSASARRTDAASLPSLRFFGWPACTPTHEHPCGNQHTEPCEPRCVCVCDCVLPRWRELSAARALALGAVACPHPACSHHTTTGGDDL
jgi:hypothetical protein